MTPTADSVSRFPVASYHDVRARLLARDEIALIDVREEDPYAQGHPLWAANFPLSKLELDAWTRIPRRDTPIVVYGEADGEDLAPRAAATLARLAIPTCGCSTAVSPAGRPRAASSSST